MTLKENITEYNDRQCGSDGNWDFNLWLWGHHASDQAMI